MTKLPPLKAREVIKGLEALGFKNVRQKGSHAIFHHKDCRRAAVPIHPTRNMSRYLLSDLLKQLNLDEDAFLQAIGRGT
jgi:predicted RNA binding protein YcfA (HicA-like mRNA interferase family)